MSDLKVEQIQGFLKNIGFDDSDFEKLAKEEIEDFTPFVEKAKHSIKHTLETDTDFIESITKPFRDAPIGKEKQLKKEARKFFNLAIKEDELTKMPLSDILAMGTENLRNAANNDDEVNKFKSAYTELLEEHEKFKNEVLPKSIEEVENKWKTKLNKKETHEALMNEIAKETPVPKENIGVWATTFNGYLQQMGLTIERDTKGTLRLKDSDGMPAKKQDGGLMQVKDALKDFTIRMSVNVKPVGTAAAGVAGIAGASKTRGLLDKLGKGFN